MKEIKSNRYLRIEARAIDGGQGIINLPRNNKRGYTTASVVWSYGGGWDHVSVAPLDERIMPTWNDMCFVKEMFFEDDEAAVEYHPAKKENISRVPNCLHLWRPQTEEMPMPPSIFV